MDEIDQYNADIEFKKHNMQQLNKYWTEIILDKKSNNDDSRIVNRISNKPVNNINTQIMSKDQLSTLIKDAKNRIWLNYINV